ncbi:MAG: hypothetical protein GX783_00705 [Clostridiales bacterium]|nr:hypothetical protein [Clostridiales bacterium]
MLYIETVIEVLLSPDMYKKYFTGLPYKKSVVSNILKQICEKYANIYGNNELEVDKLSSAIEETVKSYTSDKKTAIAIAKKLILFLGKEYSFQIEISYPPIDTSNSFERLMYIAKEMQMSEKTIEDLSDELWISTRTLEGDMARLRGDSDPLQVCGKPFIVNEVARNRGGIKFASTVHPLFLTYNITQVIATLKGLKYMCEDPILATYSMVSAKSIWQQLSEYAKDRIIYVTEHLLPDDKEWYLSLNESTDNHFYTEYECSHTDGAGVLCDCIKNGKTCYIEYSTDNGESIFIEECSIVPGSFKGNSVEVLTSNEVKTIDLHNVVRSAYTKEQLI